MKVKLGFFEIFTLMLIVLKSFELITIDWPFVLLPLAVPYVVVPFCIGVAVIFGLSLLIFIAIGTAVIDLFFHVMQYLSKYYKK